VLPNPVAGESRPKSRALQPEARWLLRVLARRGHHGCEVDLAAALAEPLVQAPLALPTMRHTCSTPCARDTRGSSVFIPRSMRAATAGTCSRDPRTGRELDASMASTTLAALVVDNRSFEVLAYVGNARSVRNPLPAILAVDIVQRPRSTGSILKPFLYAAMLDSGQLLPRMLVPDIPTQLRGFAPENFDRQFRGAVPADVALAQSLNVPAVRMLRDYGYARFYDLLQSACSCRR
jgi:penicillin-binding protein 1C